MCCPRVTSGRVFMFCQAAPDSRALRSSSQRARAKLYLAGRSPSLPPAALPGHGRAGPLYGLSHQRCRALVRLPGAGVNPHE
jgi:hypothetical protein